MMLTIIRGLPGSGKSTYAKKNFNCLILENDMCHIDNGEYHWSAEKMKFATKWCYSTAKYALSNGMDVVVCNTFTMRKYIKSYEDLAKWCNSGFQVLRCTGEYENIHFVPDDTLQHMKDHFEDWPGEEFV